MNEKAKAFLKLQLETALYQNYTTVFSTKNYWLELEALLKVSEG